MAPWPQDEDAPATSPPVEARLTANDFKRLLALELRTLRQDLAAFQREEAIALQSCLSVLLHRGGREEAARAHALHRAAWQRTRQCLLRLQDWRR